MNIIESIRLIMFGFILCLSIFHILVSIQRNKEQRKRYLSFAFLITSILGYLIIVSNTYKNSIIYKIGPSFGFILSAILGTFIGYFSMNFLCIVFGLKENKKLNFIYILNYILYLCVMIPVNIVDIIFQSSNYTKYFRKYTLLWLIIIIVSGLVIGNLRIIIEKKLNFSKNKIYLIGFLSIGFYIILFPLSFIFNFLIFFTNTFIGFSVISIIFAYAISREFTKEHRELISLKNTLEQKVKQRTKQLEDEKKQKTNFFINLAHETKTPLTLILNYLDKDIKKRGTSEEIKIVQENINKLERDMVNYLDLEKLERGKDFYLHDKIIDLSHILKIKVLMFREIANKKNIKIESELEDFIYIKIDPLALSRVINNLLDNAVKYTNENGMITVILKGDENNLFLTVKDTGIGIPEKQQQNIFKQSYQITHQKRNIQGIGMGLSIVKKIIDEVNGKIEVESEENKGTSFKITLKRHKLKENDKLYNVKMEKPAVIVSNVKLKPESNDKYSNTILIVEDNKEMLSYLQDELNKKHNVYYAENGKEALEKLEKIRKPDLIISDIMMDEMDGYQFYENLIKEEKYRTIPFIFLTAKTGTDDKLEGIKKGAVDYISKPFNIEELKAKIDSLINVQDALRIERLEELSEDLYDYLVRKKVNKELDRIENEKSSMLEKIYADYKISKRQIEIISLLKEGKERKEVADVLGISEGTVRTQMDRIYKKCDVNNKVELVNLFRV